MRKAFPVVIPAGLSWPSCAGGVGAVVTRYSWLRIDNRGGADVLVSPTQIPTNAPGEYWDYVPSGTKLTRNLGHKESGSTDDLPHSLYFLNVGISTVTLFVEIADAPINDSRSSASTGAGAVSGQTLGGNNADAVPVSAAGVGQSDAFLFGFNGATWDRVKADNGVVRVDLWDNGFAIGSRVSVPSDAAAVLGALVVQSYGNVYNGAGFDRQRALGAAADGLGVVLASQPSSTPTSVTGASGAAAVVTYAAVAGQQHRLTMLTTSAGAVSTVTVTDGGTTIFASAIPAGAYSVPLPPGGIKGSVNSALVITVALVAAQVMTVNAAKLTA